MCSYSDEGLLLTGPPRLFLNTKTTFTNTTSYQKHKIYLLTVGFSNIKKKSLKFFGCYFSDFFAFQAFLIYIFGV